MLCLETQSGVNRSTAAGAPSQSLAVPTAGCDGSPDIRSVGGGDGGAHVPRREPRRAGAGGAAGRPAGVGQHHAARGGGGHRRAVPQRQILPDEPAGREEDG